MSRSTKKPYYSITCGGDNAGNMKNFRSQYNRTLRRKEKQNLQVFDEENFDQKSTKLYKKEKVADLWQAPTDGRKVYAPSRYQSEEFIQKQMRK